jgi:hypothetical protein
MDSRSKALWPATLQQVAKFFADSPKHEAITKALIWLSSFYERPITQEALAAYLSVLEEMTTDQLQVAFSQASRECKFFPPPAELRALAGLRTARQRSESEAREGLQWILEKIRIHGKSLGPIRGALIREGQRLSMHEFIQPEYEMIECPTPSPKICHTVEALGNGDKVDGMYQLAEHPGFVTKTDGDYQSMGQRQAAIARFEERWLRTWEMANRETSVALEVVA